MSHGTLLPTGEALRRALRWLSDERRHDARAVEEAARRFDLTPVDEEFLLRLLRETRTPGAGDGQPLSEDPDGSSPQGE